MLRGAEEGLDAQMLLVPLFEEQLDLPAAAIDLADGQYRERGVIGQQQHGLAIGGDEADTTQRGRIAQLRVGRWQHAGLIADESR
jgi:hypothetical protein